MNTLIKKSIGSCVLFFAVSGGLHASVFLPYCVPKSPFTSLSRTCVRPASVPVVAAPTKKKELTQKIINRFAVSPTRAQEIVYVAHQEARKHHLDPLMVLSVIAAESSFDPNARNASGALGLMQPIPRWHEDKITTLQLQPKDLTLIRPNIQLGTLILKGYVLKCDGDMVRALQKYNGSANDASRAYSNKVLQYYRWLFSPNLQ